MNVAIRLLRLTPTEAELEFVCDDPTVEVRGVVTGPSCEYSSTIEIALTIRNSRVLIPEPAWWDPESPFLYHGRLECWSGGQKVDEQRFQFGLRHTVFSGDSIVHNGKRIAVRKDRVTSIEEGELRRLRATGVKCIEVSGAEAQAACQIADRIGLFVLVPNDLAIDPLRHPSLLTH